MLTTDQSLSREALEEEDPFSLLGENAIDQEELAATTTFLVAIFLVKLLVCLVAIAADIFLVVVICRFRNLRTTRMNMFILNATLLSLVHLVCDPFYFVLGHLLFPHKGPSLVLWQTQNTLLVLYITFAVCMAGCWFLTGYKPQLVEKYQKYSRHVFGGIYVVFTIEWIFAFIYSKNHHIARTSILTVFYVCFLGVLLLLNVLRGRVSLSPACEGTSYCLNVANVIFGAYIPMFLFHVGLKYISVDFAFYVECLPELIALSHPVFIVYELGRKDKRFRSAYKKSFERRQDYRDENLDGASENDVQDGGKA